MVDNIVKNFNYISYEESEVEKYMKLSEEDDENYKKISGVVKSKFAVDNLKKISNLIEKELYKGEKLEKIIKVRDIKAIEATTAASIAGGTLAGSLEYGVFNDLFITNKRIFFVNTNVINEEIKHKFLELKDVLGIVFTNKIVKVKKDKNGISKLAIKTSKIKIVSIIWSIISVIGFFITKKMQIESLGIFFMSSGFVTTVYSILRLIEDFTSEKFQIVLKNGYILKGLVGNDDYKECVNYLKKLNKKIK